MAQSSIDTVVFDLGGVLVDWNPRYLYRKLFDSDAQMEWFLANVCTDEWNQLQDAGRSIEEANRMLIEQHPQHRDMIEAYYGRWVEMLNGPIHGTVELLARIRDQGHRVLFLSNWSAETFPHALERFEFLHWFEGGVLSGREQTIKPEPRIYELLMQRYDVEAPRTLYVDDRAVNLSPAAELGMAVHHFTTPATLSEALIEHRLLTTQP